MSTPASLRLDRFQRREVERQLTAEMHSAHEERRLLKLRITDLMSKREMLDRSDGLSIADLRTQHLVATGSVNLAVQRFTDFVLNGIVPEDMGVEFLN